MSTEKAPVSAFPPSMGPGAQPASSRPNAQDIVRNVQEMRKHYTVVVEPTLLKIGYQINGATRNYDIPFDNAPLSGFRKWLCYGGRGRAFVSGTFLLDMIRGAENMSGQPVSQREAEAFTFHSAKRMQYGFVGMATALAAGYGMAARGAKDMKFPFRKPKPIENYDTFPLRRMPLLTGNFARLAWQTTRANFYAALGIIFLSPLFRSMGESVMAVGLYKDDRTREKVKSMKGGLDRIRMNRERPGAPQTTAESSRQSSDTSSIDGAYEGDRDNMQAFRGQSAEYQGDSAFSDDTIDTGSLSDTTMRERESTQSSPTAFGVNRQPPQSRLQNYSRGEQQSDTSSGSSDFFFDDASPTAGNDTKMAASQPYRSGNFSRGGGGSWERIRKGGQSAQGNNSSTSQATSQGSGGWQRSSSGSDPSGMETRGDSFSFSSTDANRALAKEQAQREFDNMLDRERRESGSTDYDKNSSAADPNRELSQASTDRGAWGRRRPGS